MVGKTPGGGPGSQHLHFDSKLTNKDIAGLKQGNESVLNRAYIKKRSGGQWVIKVRSPNEGILKKIVRFFRHMSKTADLKVRGLTSISHSQIYFEGSGTSQFIKKKVKEQENQLRLSALELNKYSEKLECTSLDQLSMLASDLLINYRNTELFVIKADMLIEKIGSPKNLKPTEVVALKASITILETGIRKAENLKENNPELEDIKSRLIDLKRILGINR